jgi:hypothetical protein
MSTPIGDESPLMLQETAVLEKYDTDERTPENLRERITVVDGVITEHEFFDEGGNLIDGAPMH